jgi:DNA-binding GntR family transcriptional regulator
VLSALRTHRVLREAELSRVLNVGIGAVRSLVRQMVSSGILVRDRDHVEIALMRLPAVTGLLRRRHFLHWS